MLAVESGGWTIQSVEWLVYDISSDVEYKSRP